MSLRIAIDEQSCPLDEVACNAAVEMDNLLHGHSFNPDKLSVLADFLRKYFADNTDIPPINLSLYVVLLRILQESYPEKLVGIKEIPDFRNLFRTQFIEPLEAIVRAPDSCQDQLAPMIKFCLALSKKASALKHPNFLCRYFA